MAPEAIERGRDRLSNGEVIAVAEADGFELFLTGRTLLSFSDTSSGQPCAGILRGSLPPRNAIRPRQ